MKRSLLVSALAAVLSVALAAPTARAGEPEWHSEQPVATGIGVPVPLGPVGDVEFWAPNRGLLTTAGNEGMPAGLYAYDGTGWHLYSTVCGGVGGRIAWAGPNEFWTISDYQSQQEGAQEAEARGELHGRTLCHFKDGKVVGSYAEPWGSPSTYSRMSAAACDGPGNCWFGGERLPGEPNVGAFHLHWDGQSLTAIPSLTEAQLALGDPGRAVADIAFHAGQPFESVQIAAGDQAPEETEPSPVHRIDASAPQPFVPLFPSYSPGFGPASVLRGLRFAAAGADLWAVAGAAGASGLVVLRYSGGQFVQVPLLQPVPATIAAGEAIGGVAEEPGSGSLWLGIGSGQAARLARVGGDGSVSAAISLPAAADQINGKGSAGPLACPATGQCWMATSEGWLFHLGGSLPQDTDPAMHQLITSRPCDNSCRAIPPTGTPEDDSGELETAVSEEEAPVGEILPNRRRPRPLVAKVHQQILGETVLQLSFTLRAKAHVRLLAKRGGKVVAKTPRLTLGKGRHSLRLRLDPKRWPTGLDFQVHAVAKGAAR